MSIKKELQDLADASAARIPSEAREVLASFQKELETQNLLAGLKKMGDLFPLFSLGNHLGEIVKSENLLKKGPIVINFYRGGWCPYCNVELREYQKILSEIYKKNAQLTAISPELPDRSIELISKHGLGYIVLSDLGNKFAKELGLTFKLSSELVAAYKSFGIDLSYSQGNNKNELPIPATYVIGVDHKVKFCFFDLDYRVRFEPSEVLQYL